MIVKDSMSPAPCGIDHALPKAHPASKCWKDWPVSQEIITIQFKGEPSLVRMSPDGLILKFDRTTYVVSPWPEFKIHYLNQRGQPCPIPLAFKPAILAALNDLRQSSNQAQRLAVYDLVRHLPLWAHARLVPMRQHYWLGVETLVKLPESLDLLESSPALFAVVAQYAQAGCFHDGLRDTLLARLGGRQRELARWLGFGDAESCPKLLRRFSFYDYSYSQWRVLARNMRKLEVRQALQRTQAISNSMVDFLVLTDSAQIFSASALGEAILRILKLGPSGIKQREYIDEILTWGGLIRKFGVTVAPVPSLTVLQQLRAQSGEAFDRLPISPGPSLDIPDIAPITSPHELKTEALVMGHCAGSPHYVLEGLRGNYCFYRMNRPDRATICLERSSGLGAWKLHQIQGPKNISIPDASRDLVRNAILKASGRL